MALEKLLSQIPGVEHIYSRSGTGQSVVTLPFFVGEDREDALLNVYNKLYSNQDQIPSVVTNWLVKPVEVDDLPVLMPGLWSDQPDLYGDFELRRFCRWIFHSRCHQTRRTNRYQRRANAAVGRVARADSQLR